MGKHIMIKLQMEGNRPDLKEENQNFIALMLKEVTLLKMSGGKNICEDALTFENGFH